MGWPCNKLSRVVRSCFEGHDFAGCEKLGFIFVLKGHDFSRAGRTLKSTWAFAPEGRLFCTTFTISELFPLNEVQP
jgi:hypothetical protein